MINRNTDWMKELLEMKSIYKKRYDMKNEQNKEYLTRLLIKYQEVVERAFLLEYRKNADGYKQKGSALEDFDIMNDVVTKEIMNFEKEMRDE